METSESIRPDKQTAPESTFQQPLGRVLRYEIIDDVALLYCSQANLAISFPLQGILRLTSFTTDMPNLNETAAIAAKLTPAPIVERATGDVVTFTASGLEVAVTRGDSHITVTDSTTGQVLARNLQLSFTNSGVARILGAVSRHTHYYGLGEKTGFLDKRGESYAMWNSDVYAPHVPEIDALYVSIPFLIPFESGQAAGVFLDNPGKSTFDMRQHEEAYEIHANTGGLDIYIVAGPTLKDVVSRYTGLTGRMPLPPKWAMGYHQSRYSYMSQNEVVELAQEFRSRDIPLDAVYLDIHYMDGYRVFTFDGNRFPNPKEMTAELERLGVKVVPIVDPGVKQDSNYPVYRDGVEMDRFCKSLEGDIFIADVWPGQSAFPDFTDEDVAKWWGDLHQFYMDLGIRGIWNDMNEPAVFNDIKTMEPQIMHRNNGDAKTHEQLHNLYGLLMSRATYQAIKEQLDGKRPFVLTRSGYAGVQRYAAVWTGDNRSFWEHMELAVPMVLNLGLSGIAFTGPDVGGFAHHTSGQLLARWTQMGAFFPFFRNHSALDTVRQEPWLFGEEIEAICRRYIQLRYQWLPYMYSLFAEAAATGIPVMRPLVLEYPQDENTYNLSNEFLVGKDVLVAPIFRPDTWHRMVYLPEGVWYNYWTGERHDGNQHILVDAPLDTLPVFVRRGAIVPQGPIRQSTAAILGDATSHADQVPQDTVFHVFLDEDRSPVESTFTYYEDDGETFAYTRGEFVRMDVALEATEQSLTLTCQELVLPPTTDSAIHFDGVTFVIHGLSSTASVVGLPSVVQSKFAQCEAGWTFDAEDRTLSVKVKSFPKGKRIEVQR